MWKGQTGKLPGLLADEQPRHAWKGQAGKLPEHLPGDLLGIWVRASYPRRRRDASHAIRLEVGRTGLLDAASLESITSGGIDCRSLATAAVRQHFFGAKELSMNREEKRRQQLVDEACALTERNRQLRHAEENYRLDLQEEQRRLRRRAKEIKALLAKPKAYEQPAGLPQGSKLFKGILYLSFTAGCDDDPDSVWKGLVIAKHPLDWYRGKVDKKVSPSP